MNRKVIAAAIALLILVLGAGGAIYLFRGPTDTRLYAQDATTGDKYPLVFLYAVDSTSGKILTYSPIIGEITGVGNLKQSDCVVAASDTVTGAPSSCNRVEAGDGDLTGDNQPFLTWSDMQDGYQQQFFTSGQVVFITEQPLKEGPNKVLAGVPVSATN